MLAKCRSQLVWLICLVLLGVAWPATADQLSYFRHDHGNAGDAFPLPDDFSQDARLQWRVELPSGHSTPCVIGDAIFLTTYDASVKQLATVALDRASGQIRWRRVVPTERFESVHPTGSLATASPASNGRQVFAFFGSYGLLCYDWQGELLWEKRLGPFQDEFGAASSPILVDDLVVLNQDHDVDSFLMAIDQRSGETRWKTDRAEATRSYATPVILDRDGTRQILIAGALQLAAYDLKTGEKVWWYDGLSRLVDCTPVVEQGLVYVATWSPGGDADSRIAMEPFAEALAAYDANGDGQISRNELPAGSPVLERFFRMDINQDGALDQAEWERHAAVFAQARNVAVAIEPGNRGPLSDQYVRWTFTRGLPTVPSSVVYDGVMTMVKDSGIVTTLDVSSGRMLRQFRALGRGNYYASLVAGDGKVYLTSEAGVITVLKSGPDGEILSSHDFGERIMATPVIRDGTIYVRTAEALYSFVKS